MSQETTAPKPRGRRPKATTSKGHYITNATLLPEVIRAKELGRVTNELAEMLMMIAIRYSFKSNFGGYSFREDMVSSALVNLCANALKFKPEMSNNPFAYYTTSIHNSFLQYMSDERKHRDIRDKLIVEAGSNPSFTAMGSAHEEFLREHGAYDEHGEVSHTGYDEFNTYKLDMEPGEVVTIQGSGPTEEPIKKEDDLLSYD